MVTMDMFTLVLSIIAVLQQSTYCSGRNTNLRLAKVYTSYQQEKDGCAYEGYDPYRSPEIIKMGHPVAKLQTTVMQDIYISEDFTIALGTVGSIQEVLDQSVNLLDKIDTKMLTDAMHFASKMASTSFSVLSPVLGILVSVFDAVAGVQTPTHKDILDATNKALKTVTDDVDEKMKEAKNIAANKVHMLEMDINNRKHEFLFKFWTSCEGLETEEMIDMCQREAYLMILASIDEFLLFTDKLDKNAGVFSGLDDTQIRRIELGMVAYRNYATLAMLSLKTLGITYARLRKIEQNKLDPLQMQSCEEMNNMIRKQQKKNKKLKGKEKKKMVNVPPKLKYYCFFKEELVTKAKYFEIYGKAAIDAMIAETRTLDYKEVYKTASHIAEQKRFTNHLGSARSKIEWTEWIWERRISCNAKLHPSKNAKCQYEISLVEKPENIFQSNDLEKAMSWIDDRDYYNKPKGYEFEQMIEDGEIISGGKWTVDMTTDNDDNHKRSETSKWCEGKIRKRFKEYITWEKLDMERYWINEVMTVVTCGRILAENIEKDCQLDTLRKYLPFSNEQTIRFGSTTGTNADKAIDGLLTSVSISERKVRPTWIGQFKHPATIKEIHLFIPNTVVYGTEDATVDSISVKGYPAASSKTVHRHRTWDDRFIFYIIYDGYRYMVLTDTTGKKLKGGYTAESNVIDYWTTPKKWTKDSSYEVKIHGFKGINPSARENQLKVETGDGTNIDDMEWKDCKVYHGLPLAAVLKASNPIKVTCDNPTGEVNAVKLTVDEDRPTILKLAEIRVIGFPKEQELPKNPTVMAVDLITATQSSWNHSFATHPENAIDGKSTTISSTNEQQTGEELWLQVELEKESPVTSVKVELYGAYKNVAIKVSLTGKDDGEWTQCGDIGQEVDGYSFKGFEQKCENLKSAVKFVRVTAQPKSGKNILKVKEITVLAPYEDE